MSNPTVVYNFPAWLVVEGERDANEALLIPPGTGLYSLDYKYATFKSGIVEKESRAFQLERHGPVLGAPAYIFGLGACLSSGRTEQQTMIAIRAGDKVRIDDVTGTLALDHNNNYALINIKVD